MINKHKCEENSSNQARKWSFNGENKERLLENTRSVERKDITWLKVAMFMPFEHFLKFFYATQSGTRICSGLCC